MELQLGLALPNHSNPSAGNGVGFRSRKDAASKRSFQEAFGNHKMRDEMQMMPLLLWSGQPGEDDDQEGHKKRNSCNSVNKNEEEEEELVVGWPPIQSWRKKLLLHGQHLQQGQVGRRISKFVKVKMEGVGIARKINLSLYNSFETLANSLVHMFAAYQKSDEKRGVRYTLTYQDKEGDWLIAGDVPWPTFVESVQRLEILRCGAVESRP